MRTLFVVTVMFVAVFILAVPGLAQTPTVSVYFDDALVRMDKDCPPGGGADSAFVVVRGFNSLIYGIEYEIDYPGTMTWVADYDTPPVTIGTTPSGISEAWTLPFNAIGTAVVAKVLFMWNCNGCTVEDDPVVVVAHTATGLLGATRFPDYVIINAVGMTSLVCATVPADETTWGRVKSLYSE